MATFSGGTGDDNFPGTADPDQAMGGGGNDSLTGLGGEDELEGDDGADTLDGGSANDRLYSGPAPGSQWMPASPSSLVPALDRTAEVDSLIGGDGNDLLSGGYGDQIDGGDGNDSLLISFKAATAGIVADLARLSTVQTLTIGTTSLSSIESVLWVEGSEFADTLAVASTDQAVIYGLGGDDRITSSLLSRDIYGGAGNDTLDNSASSGANTLYGDAGNDILIGGGQVDTLEGGDDGDTISGNAGNDVLRGGEGDDLLRGGVDDDDVQGGGGDDTLYGGAGNDQLDGGTGNDVIFGADGPPNPNENYSADVIDGGEGDDILHGSIGSTLRGGTGADTIYGSLGSSNVDAGDGDDRFYALYTSADYVLGGAGNDVIDLGSNGDEAHGGSGDDIIFAGDEPVAPHTADALYGDEGNDKLYFGGDLGSSPQFGVDRADGGDGEDEVIVQGHYEFDGFTGYALYSTLLQNVETLRALSASDDSYGHARAGETYSYNFVVLDDLQGTGGRFTIDGSGLGPLETLTVDAGSETDGIIEIRGGAGADRATLGAVNDVVDGGDGSDVFDLRRGGDDQVSAGAGNDGLIFGSTLTAADRVDGGGGTDTLAIQGAYAGLSLAGITNVDVLLLLSGSSNQFGEGSSSRFGYTLSASDATVAAGETLTIQAPTLLIGENLVFDGSAELDGGFRIFAGRGIDSLIGGAGSDGFLFGSDGNFTRADHVDGGAGTDTLALRGNYAGANALALQGSSFTNIEVLSILSGHSGDYGGVLSDTGFHYEISLSNGNVAAGRSLDVNAARLGPDESLSFDGRAEGDGSFRIFGGSGDDTLYGGTQGDLIYGGLGQDRLDGSSGQDIFFYRSAAESTSIHYDTIVHFDWDNDLIDVPNGSGPRGFSQSLNGHLSTDTFDVDLAAALEGVLGANGAVLYSGSSGSLAGFLFAVIDGNGVAGYQAGEDYVINLETALSFEHPMVQPIV